MGDSSDRTASTEAVGAALGAVVGVAVGGPVGAVVGAAVSRPLTDLVGAAWQELRGRREASATEVVVRAAHFVGEDPEKLLNEALADEGQSRLLQAALQAAAASLDAAKVQALARALANGVTDDARLDEELMVVRALADLDPAHVRVLAYLGEATPTGMHPYYTLTRLNQFLGEGPPLVGNRNMRDVAGPIVAALERHGLVDVVDETPSERQDHGYNFTLGYRRARITQFGATCLGHLEQHDIAVD